MTLFSNLEWPLRSPVTQCYLIWSIFSFVFYVTVLHTLKLNLMLMSNTFLFHYRLIVKRAKRCTQNQCLTRKQVKNNILLLPHQWPVHVCKVFNVYLYTYMYIYSILLDSIFSCWSLLMYENDLLTFDVR